MQTSESTRVAQPGVFQVDATVADGNWVAEGTDGHLYLVPAEPAGWLRRSPYVGPRDCLLCLPPKSATNIAWYLYGAVGTITIEWTSLRS